MVAATAPSLDALISPKMLAIAAMAGQKIKSDAISLNLPESELTGDFYRGVLSVSDAILIFGKEAKLVGDQVAIESKFSHDDDKLQPLQKFAYGVLEDMNGPSTNWSADFRKGAEAAVVAYGNDLKKELATTSTPLAVRRTNHQTLAKALGL